LAPEAWALDERIATPVTAAFLPGVYDVLGEAGDQVFAGRITVVPGGETHFVIPLDPALSPAGPDDFPATGGPTDPVSIDISGIYAGMFVHWRATPAGGQDSLVLESAGFAPEAWQTRLDPGRWLIEGQAETGKGPLYVALVQVEAGHPRALTLPRTTGADRTAFTLPDGAVGVARCVAEPACHVGDAAAKIRYVLLPGWAASAGYVMETAAGVAATQPSAEFYAGTPLQLHIALNPRQWQGSLGPCETVTLGNLCHLPEADPAAVALLRSSLQRSDPTPEATTGVAATPGGGPAVAEVLTKLQGIVLTPPEGLDLRDFLAPNLTEETP
jgi:Ca-activated chloride channel homolog